ncbi:uncharacterized protein LOC129916395 [Episyrphus balteatus]|uniref:uncharacterized protein LOC129916395 n=1 Tax=Episyrphus balteatus TaxID=286459 RepID=UPI00248584F1|nr:uncharacterized protein LOC129916395 [Episyrphus balteatus]XP_055852273.1 uncharacterized protein LOC129916395 [Episyrphus balteatus]XP_055852274.1 uncharacterized protein LOC129916395 [Episyrphus balteatus]
MSGSPCHHSSPTTENNGKNSSDTSTCNGGVHVCPFQLVPPPINQFTYCALKRICRQILKEILLEEQDEHFLVNGDLKIPQDEDIKRENDDKSSSACSTSSMSAKNNHERCSEPINIVLKSNKSTQTMKMANGVENNTFIKNRKTNKEVKKKYVLKPERNKNGLPIIFNLRSKVRNGETFKNNS